MSLPRTLKGIKERVKIIGDTITGTLKINKTLTVDGDALFNANTSMKGILKVGVNYGDEGGEIHLEASPDTPEENGIVLDQCDSKFRIYGIQSADGTTKMGVGTPLIIDPYEKIIDGEYNVYHKAGYFKDTITIDKDNWSHICLSTNNINKKSYLQSGIVDDTYQDFTVSNYYDLKNNKNCSFTFRTPPEGGVNPYSLFIYDHELAKSYHIYGQHNKDVLINDFKLFNYLGLNPCTEATDTVDFWANKGTGYCFIDGLNILKNQPYPWALLKNYVNNNWVIQEFHVANTPNEGKIYRRYGLIGRNNNLWEDSGGWTVILDATNFSNYALPLTGGIVNGNVVFTQDVKFKGNYGGIEGGQFTLTKPENNTGFNQDISVDIYGNLFRVYSVHDNILKTFNLDFTSAPEGHHTILHSANSINYGSKYSFTLPQIYDGTTQRVDIKAFMDNNNNIHKTPYQGEMNFFRFFAAEDEGNYASYNLPCVDSHVLSFSIDWNNGWTRLLALDLRTPNIYTITKNSGSWRSSWDMLYGTQNVTSGTGSASIAVEKGIYIRY